MVKDMSTVAVQTGNRKQTPIRRLKAAGRKIRELAIVGHSLASTSHPIMAHIIPIRRCNLSCTYCNEYDDFSKPVPLER